MSAHIIIDLGFGDSGKGNCVQYMCSRPTIGDHTFGTPKAVVRFNGGHQVGHGVRSGDTKHIFSSFGSGTLLDIPTYWGPECTIEPRAFNREYVDLCKKGHPPLFYADPECPITTFLDIEHNRKDTDYLTHGTVGVGFGSTLQRQQDNYRLVLSDLKYPTVVRMKMKLIANYYGYSLTGDVCNRIEEFLNVVSIFIDRVNVITPEEFSKNVIMGRDVVFEGAQGVLLDKDYGFFPHVTRSKTTSYNAFKLCSRMLIRSKQIHITHVTRTYHTRHGNGPFVDGVLNLDTKGTENNNWDRFQGEFRVGPLDMNLLRYAKYCDSGMGRSIPKERRNLFISCCDQLEPSDELIEFSSDYGNTIFSYSDDARENHKTFQNKPNINQ